MSWNLNTPAITSATVAAAKELLASNTAPQPIKDYVTAGIDGLAARHGDDVLVTVTGYGFTLSVGGGAFAIVLLAGHAGFVDGWVLRQCVFDFGREDHLAIDFDHLAQSAGDADVAFRCQFTHVTRAQPAILEGSARLFGHLPVSHHDLGPAY